MQVRQSWRLTLRARLRSSLFSLLNICTPAFPLCFLLLQCRRDDWIAEQPVTCSAAHIKDLKASRCHKLDARACVRKFRGRAALATPGHTRQGACKPPQVAPALPQGRVGHMKGCNLYAQIRYAAYHSAFCTIKMDTGEKATGDVTHRRSTKT